MHIISNEDLVIFIFAYRSSFCIQAIILVYFMYSLSLYLFIAEKVYRNERTKSCHMVFHWCRFRSIPR